MPETEVVDDKVKEDIEKKRKEKEIPETEVRSETPRGVPEAVAPHENPETLAPPAAPETVAPPVTQGEAPQTGQPEPAKQDSEETGFSFSGTFEEQRQSLDGRQSTSTGPELKKKGDKS